ncbi:phosphoribosyltransferase family protein [Acinetobacter baumannii]|uniref:Phosphoribosyltransferase n=14 Tax=Acinetobacter baumannii TaxID=470 RepID=A0A506IFK4_ACIBA|nr:phosphoribosyltransferase [Acinetobacter baumannii]EIB7039073.1 phosphoribosyltransferase [Acinetobacter baumannii]EIB7179601.1 phosphoribosyltransferase [Acinetobacter baumannii]EKV3807762.1 phosphoribosyltransferase [Acinetobacter baumannii]EKW1173974.1 phosphoribosyltransferase [Acinetobacter baumannii]KAB8125576.1 phosphoribosyltransferase [Acinetobacter baumannii]
MGITVDKNKVVTFTAQTEQLVNTSIDANPNQYKLNDLVIYGIFKRLYSRQGGDGNPLIYALKGQRGYSISLQECGKFNPNLSAILDHLLTQKNYEVILTMPSSHKVVERFAIKINRRISKDCLLITDIFTKKTFSEVYEDLQNLPLTPQYKRDIIALRRTIERDAQRNPHKVFSMKEVDTKDRMFIRPLKINPERMKTIQQIQGKSILLVDDLLASGTTLTSAYNLLKDLEISDEIEAICLLGKLGNK